MRFAIFQYEFESGLDVSGFEVIVWRVLVDLICYMYNNSAIALRLINTMMILPHLAVKQENRSAMHTLAAYDLVFGLSGYVKT